MNDDEVKIQEDSDNDDDHKARGGKPFYLMTASKEVASHYAPPVWFNGKIAEPNSKSGNPPHG